MDKSAKLDTGRQFLHHSNGLEGLSLSSGVCHLSRVSKVCPSIETSSPPVSSRHDCLMYCGRPPAVCTESFQCSHLQAAHPARAPVTRANTTDLITLSGGLRRPGMYRSHQPHVSPLAYVILFRVMWSDTVRLHVLVSRENTSALRIQWTNKCGLRPHLFWNKE
ncbi:hypothetical protein QQF64_006717 [Cirrhinus molitorella]|uniref:Uncharacterized protein n=1 Tax=Cirrhinus molitorella TaxID=172907 RepID=A0ABR3M8M3_9TELE